MSEIRRSFGINLTVMEFLGLYSPEYPNLTHKTRSYTMYILSLMPAAMCSILGFLFKEDAKINDYNSFVNVGMVMYVFKFMPLVKNPESLKKCIECLNYFKIIQHQQEHIVEECIYICRRNTMIFVSGMVMGWVSWCAKPFFWEESYRLPLNIWLPFEITDKPIVYVCTYIFLATGVGYAAIACGVVDSLIWGLACHIACQLKILKHTLQHLDEHSETVSVHIPSRRKKIIFSNCIYCKIRSSVIHYRAISDFVNRYEQSFSQVVFSQLTGSIFIIGLCCLQLTRLPLYDFNSVMMISYLCFILLQIYFSCYYGTNLFEENATLCNAIYMGNWYNYDQNSKQALSILMERSKYPMIVTVGKVVELSLETFTTIIKRSYSLLAVLQNSG